MKNKSQGTSKVGEKPILIVNRTDSICANCGYNCDPSEKTHKTNLGYSEELRKKPGCGIKWEYVGSHYGGEENKKAVMRLRPDLQWTDEIIYD